FDRPGEREAVGRDDADVGLAVDEAVRREVLGVDDRRIDVGEDLELVGDARVIAVGGEAVADAALAPLRFDERLDHAVRLGLLANPAVGKDAHWGSNAGAGPSESRPRDVPVDAALDAVEPAEVRRLPHG